jgi:hypothetical protein
VQTAHGSTRPLDRPTTEYPTCTTIPSPLHQVSYSCHDTLSLHAMPHLPPTHHKTSKHDCPNETKIKEKQNETIMDSNSNLAKPMTHHNQTKKITTWFLVTPAFYNNKIFIKLVVHYVAF